MYMLLQEIEKMIRSSIPTESNPNPDPVLTRGGRVRLIYLSE